jgi:cyclic pyranopterin phosphate synthase
MKKLSHLDARGEARMVDVSAKPVVLREAVARGEIRMARATLRLLASQRLAKGNVLAAARLAGILAAKKTGELIPLCHPLPLTHCEVNFQIPSSRDRVVITACAKIAARTGVEMEALTAVTMAALTIYDMCKAVDQAMRITDVALVSKTKGPSRDPSVASTQPAPTEESAGWATLGAPALLPESWIGAFAGPKPAIQQVANLRYQRRPVRLRDSGSLSRIEGVRRKREKLRNRVSPCHFQPIPRTGGGL